jgi:hypothetical protein
MHGPKNVKLVVFVAVHDRWLFIYPMQLYVMNKGEGRELYCPISTEHILPNTNIITGTKRKTY